MKYLIEKYKSIIMYLFFGVCTTLVNVITYYVFTKFFEFTTMPATVIAWVLAVLFAYITNRLWVFESQADTINDFVREIIAFFACRLTTGILDLLIMFIFVDLLYCNDLLVKIGANVLVIILNYVASKLIIFKN